MTYSTRDPAADKAAEREARVTLAAECIVDFTRDRGIGRDLAIVEALAPDGLSSGADDHHRAMPAPSVDPEDV